MSETYSLPKRSSKDTNTYHKKAKQNSSDLAEPRRFPTASFGLSQKQETESYATPVVDSNTESGGCEASATQEMNRKFNPFWKNGKSPAIPENAPRGVLPEPLSLDTSVTLIMSHPRATLDPNLN